MEVLNVKRKIGRKNKPPVVIVTEFAKDNAFLLQISHTNKKITIKRTTNKT